MTRWLHFGIRASAMAALLLGLVLYDVARPGSATSASGALVGTVTVTGVEINHSSVRISFDPVVGAKDYRAYDTADPSKVKYAGMVHLEIAPPWCGCSFATNPDGTTSFPYHYVNGTSGPQSLDLPNTQIDWNSLGDDGAPHTLVVEAVDALGLIPSANLYNADNSPKVFPLSAGARLGGNSGATGDGKTSTNGQGSSTNAPNVIAQSVPFVAQADHSKIAVPSRQDAVQSFYDTFDQSEASTLTQVSSDPGAMTKQYTLNGGSSKAWTIQYLNSDTTNSVPFISASHFMDVLFDGGTPGTANPLHTSYGTMSMLPQPGADISGGKLLHMTMEVDDHQSGRRWMAFELTPSGDPITNPNPSSGPVNADNRAVEIYLTNGGCTGTAFQGGMTMSSFWGALGQATNVCNRTAHFGGNGIALDNRSRFDLFMTQSYAALFEDGQLVIQSAIPGGVPFSQAQLSFVHYVYHTANDVTELQQGAPWEQYWLNSFPYSDERHWDNMGFEVLPASAAPSGDWTSLGGLIKMPQVMTPTFTQQPPIGTPSSSVTSSPTVAASPSSTVTGMPSPTATTVMQSATPTPTPIAPSGSGILGHNAVGTQIDTNDSNYINGSRFTTGSAGGTVNSLSVYVGSVDTPPHNLYQLAIYTDNGGVPESIIATSAAGSLTPNAWNVLPITATLAPNTSYWLLYNTNGTTTSVNNLAFDTGGQDAYSLGSIPFGTWPATFGPVTKGNLNFSIYAIFANGTMPAPTPVSPSPTVTPIPPTSTITPTSIPSTTTATPIPPTVTIIPTPIATVGGISDATTTSPSNLPPLALSRIQSTITSRGMLGNVTVRVEVLDSHSMVAGSAQWTGQTFQPDQSQPFYWFLWQPQVTGTFAVKVTILDAMGNVLFVDPHAASVIAQ